MKTKGHGSKTVALQVHQKNFNSKLANSPLSEGVLKKKIPLLSAS